jgi:hypothetical protein
MALDFDSGSATSPRGHAIIYFRARYDPEKLLAIYAITLPITFDFSKFVPPFLTAHLAADPLKELKAFSLPPVPEEVESYEYLRRLSETRSDDLVCGGSVPTNDLPEMMQMAGDAVQEYERLWTESQPEASSATIVEPGGETSSASSGASLGDASLGVNEVLYSLMNDSDRLQELSKLVGKLRFALDGKDSALSEETCDEIVAVGRHMPANYEVTKLLAAMMGPDPKGATLTQLYMDRCYRLLEGDKEGVQQLEERIKGLEEAAS